MHPTAPHAFERRILVATLGQSPAVITETLYALATAQPHPFIPTELHILTTSKGAHHAELLTPPDTGQIDLLASSLRSQEIGDLRRTTTVHVLKGGDGEYMADIASSDDSHAGADQILAIVRGMTSDPSSAVHVSIAGGRKTMGFLIGYALSLYGRPQDRLSHVLLLPPYESDKTFFFPRDAFEARAIQLANIPFVRMRNALPTPLLDQQMSFSELVNSMQAALQAPSMSLDHQRCVITCGGAEISLQPMTFAVIAWIARNSSSSSNNSTPGAMAGVREEYAVIPHSRRPQLYYNSQIIGPDMDIEPFVREHVSRFRRSVRQRLGSAASPFLPVMKRTQAGQQCTYAIECPVIGLSK